MEPLNILAVNCGSSSLKFGLYAATEDTIKLLCEGEAEAIGSKQDEGRFQTHEAAFERALEQLPVRPQAVGHRFVHGGTAVREHQLVSRAVIERLRAAAAFAPLHVPAALSVLDAANHNMPGIPQAVCLDTAFHRTLPDVSRTFALPAEVRRLGVERFGFHGLSLESILPQLAPVPKRLVIAHLGNGCSITAIEDGRSIDTTMGLTPTGGVMMGTRCGDLDPGAMVYLLRNGYENAGDLETLFDKRSGLAGVSGETNDVRTLLTLRSRSKEADLALRMFSYQVRKAIAAMAAALGGMDLLVFTGGIGEHASELREEILAGLRFLGNFERCVLPSREDHQIAAITVRLVNTQSTSL